MLDKNIHCALVINYFSCNSNVETILKNSALYVFSLSKSNTSENTGYRNWMCETKINLGVSSGIVDSLN